MAGMVCPRPNAAIVKLTEDIKRLYPKASERNKVDPVKVAQWTGMYITDHQLPLDHTPSAKELVEYIEKLRNQEGKSFLYGKGEYVVEGSKEHQQMLEEQAKANSGFT